VKPVSKHIATVDIVTHVLRSSGHKPCQTDRNMTCSSKKSPVFAAFWKIARPMSGKFSIPSTGIIAVHDHAHSGATT
jgi:hypothetical protein